MFKIRKKKKIILLIKIFSFHVLGRNKIRKKQLNESK